MAFPVLAAVIGAGLGAVYTKASGGSNRDMIKNALIGAALGTAGGYAFPKYLGAAGAGATQTAGSTQYAALMGAAGNPTYAASGGGGLANTLSNLSTGKKLALGAAAASPLLMGSGDKKVPFQPPFDESEYTAAYGRSRENLEGLGQRFNYQDTPQSIVNNPAVYNMPQMSTGGIVGGVPGFKTGGVTYLPSKLDHDEKDKTNYMRASGYIEDATDIADKDEDTMLAQLADGEFVSRADAVLGAGIMEGADPKDFKDMRKRGAKYFYNQQDQLKRIYDLVT